MTALQPTTYTSGSLSITVPVGASHSAAWHAVTARVISGLRYDPSCDHAEPADNSIYCACGAASFHPVAA